MNREYDIMNNAVAHIPIKSFNDTIHQLIDRVFVGFPACHIYLNPLHLIEPFLRLYSMGPFINHEKESLY